MNVPVWLVVALSCLSFLSLILAAALYSVRTQRYVRVLDRNLDSIDELCNAVQGLTRGWMVEGNSIELLENGEGFFPRLLEDLGAAQHSIHIETFVWWKGDICRRVGDCLSQRAREGVEVRLVLDWVGSNKMDDRLERKMTEAGVRIAKYNALAPRTFARVNKRTHRKLAIIDGTIGYVHGHGYAEEWEGNGDSPESWSDLGARVLGPVVLRLQAVFAQHWMEESAEVLADDAYFPRLEAAGDVSAHVVSSSPRGGVSEVGILVRLMIGVARQELLIQNPYFAPAEPLVRALVHAVERGVRVRVMTPGPVTDSILCQYAGRRQFTQLLEAGVEIYQFQPTLLHQKVIVVDGEWCKFGSVNLDERSFDINAEVSLSVFDRGVAQQLRAIFERDLKHCVKLELDSWKRRPLHRRLLEQAAYLFNQQV